MSKDGEIHPVRLGLSLYVRRWYESLLPTTNALDEYVARGINRAVAWAPDRMVDAAEEMLASYRRNENTATPNRNALLPMAIMAMAKDYSVTLGDWGHNLADKKFVRLVDEPDAQYYGYRHVMADFRAQIVLFAAEDATARSLASQFALFISATLNRRFIANYEHAGIAIPMTVMIENPDIVFQSIPNDQKNLTMLAGDITLKTIVPYFDANPTAAVQEIDIVNINSLTETVVATV